MKTLRDVLLLAAAYLEARGVERARRMAEELLSYALSLPRVELYLQHDRPLTEEELAPVRGWMKRLGEGEPLAYVLGFVEFFGCRIEVDRSVLIPRPETEILLDLACKALQGSEGVVWDLCCGSGCLGIGLKKRLPQLEVVLADCAQEALVAASRNARLNGVEVTLREGDLLSPFQGEKALAILCNPPYIAEKEYPSLHASVRDFEPRQALVGGPSGLEYYARLAQQMPSHLRTGGRVFMEIGSGQGEAVQRLFSAPCWQRRRVEQDWAGHDRFFFLEIE
jgi:release factor glutamine methyltransferase